MNKGKTYGRHNKQNADFNRYISLTEAAKICSCSKATFQRWAVKYDIVRKNLDTYYNPLNKRTSVRMGYLESEVRNFRKFISGKYLSIGLLIAPSNYCSFGNRYSVFSNFFALGRASVREDFDIIGVDKQFIKHHSADLLSLSKNIGEVYILNDEREDSDQTYSFRQFRRLVSRRIRQLANRYDPAILIEGLEDEREERENILPQQGNSQTRELFE